MKSHPRRSHGFRAVGHVDFTSERIAVKSRTGSCGHFHPRTHFYGGILFGGIHVCGEGGTSTFDPEGRQRLAVLGGSRSCATADGTPVDTGAKNCDPPVSAIDGARRDYPRRGKGGAAWNLHMPDRSDATERVPPRYSRWEGRVVGMPSEWGQKKLQKIKIYT